MAQKKYTILTQYDSVVIEGRTRSVVRTKYETTETANIIMSSMATKGLHEIAGYADELPEEEIAVLSNEAQASRGRKATKQITDDELPKADTEQ